VKVSSGRLPLVVDQNTGSADAATNQLDLPAGVSHAQTLARHEAPIETLAWTQDGRTLASASRDETIILWSKEGGSFQHVLPRHAGRVSKLAFGESDQILASVGDNGRCDLTDVATGRLIKSDFAQHCSCVAYGSDGLLVGGQDNGVVWMWRDATSRKSPKRKTGEIAPGGRVTSLALDVTGTVLAIGATGGRVEVWKITSKQKPQQLTDGYHGGHHGSVYALAFDPTGQTLASGGEDHTIRIWEAYSGRLLRTLEGHTAPVRQVMYVANGALLLSRDLYGTVRISDGKSGAFLAAVEPPKGGNTIWIPSIACAPTQSQLAVAIHGRWPRFYGGNIELWNLDVPGLLAQTHASGVTYASAKIVLVGESGVGKTGLGWRLAHGEFREHASTHGQQFWLLDQLRSHRTDGALCEAVLWDLAGQPDYRLIHALFLDDADIALLLFDPTRDDDALRGVEYWLQQLGISGEQGAVDHPKVLLVAGRSDRGDSRMTQSELEQFCCDRGVAAYVVTSALDGHGLDELIERMRLEVDWDSSPTTVTSIAFKVIKDHVLRLKQEGNLEQLILSPRELRGLLEEQGAGVQVSEHELLSALAHLSNHGYITRLKTSQGKPRILIAPDLLNNIAASIVLEARRNPKGLGSLEEHRVLSGDYQFRELDNLSLSDREILLDSAVAMFLDHNICFRETDPLSSRCYLVFPELINLKKPASYEAQTFDNGPSYAVSGAVENVYASLVVLLGYTNTFLRANQWHNHAQYVVGDGSICGFRLDAKREGALDLVLYFGKGVPSNIRALFQSLFESFLTRRDLLVRRFERVFCANEHELSRADVRLRLEEEEHEMFCMRCGERVELTIGETRIELSGEEAADLGAERNAAAARSRFEQAIFRIKAYVTKVSLDSPECFISYAWGNVEHERWVELELATDLVNAGLTVIMDRWENSRIGASVPRFVERVADVGRVIVVGTPLYREKYENGKPMRGFVVAAEGDLIGTKMIRDESSKRSVLPVLLAGTEEESFPPLLQGRVYADFREQEVYFEKLLDLILSIYEIESHGEVGIAARQVLRTGAHNSSVAGG